METYFDFLEAKKHYCGNSGFKPLFVPDALFDFQKYAVEYSINKGRSAIFADCGLGKTIMQLVWAENVLRHSGKPVLVLTPLAVAHQTQREAEKFGIDCSLEISSTKTIHIANYEKLHHFNANDFSGVVCDESSILKNFNGAIKNNVTEFMKKTKYRLLATATAAPNDYIELGTSSEALGYLGFMDMLNRFFKNDQNNSSLRRHYGEAPKWRFKGYAELPFWRWVNSWALTFRKPSDIGFNDDKFVLKPLHEKTYLIENTKPKQGMLFSLPATTLPEQREETKRTILERCGLAVDIVKHTGKSAIIWCHMNDEATFLRQNLNGDSVEISGSDSDEKKVDKFESFLSGNSRVLITKPKIGAWGLNFQHCNHIVYFPSHSYEQYYQAVRRCWRFGQKQDVLVEIITTPGGIKVMENLKRKNTQADKMFSNMVREMNNASMINKINKHTKKEVVPVWL